MSLLVNVRLLLEFLIDSSEVSAHQRALARILATRVDEGQEKHLALVVMNVNCLAILIDEPVVWHFITRLCSDTLAACWTGRVRPLLCYRHIFVGSLEDPGRSFADDEGHRHARHVIFDVLVRDGYKVLIFLDSHDLAFQVVMLLCCRSDSRARLATRKAWQQKQNDGKYSYRENFLNVHWSLCLEMQLRFVAIKPYEFQRQ